MEKKIISVLGTYGAVFTVSRVTCSPSLCYPLAVDLEKWGEVAKRTECPVLPSRTHYDIRAFWPDGTESVTWAECPKHGNKWHVPEFDFYFRALRSEKYAEKYGPDFLPSNKVRRFATA